MAQRGLADRDTQIYYFKQYRQFWASGPAASVAVVAGAPFENVKTRMQSRHFSSAWAATKYVYRHEGIRGFWTGTYAPLVSLTATRTAGFIIYRRAKYEVDRVISSTTGESPLEYVNVPGTYPTIWTNLCFGVSGMISGAILTPILTPVELLKNAAQTSVLMASPSAQIPRGPGIGSVAPTKNPARVGSYEAAKRIIKHRGVGALWTGFRLHLLRDTVGSGVYFGVYESCKQALGSYYGDDMKNTPWAIPLAGATCGVMSWIATYPIDTMKTRVQNNLLGVPQKTASATLDAATKAVSRASKWHGVEMIILRSCVQNMIQMTAFEHVKVLIDDAQFSDGSKNLPNVRREKGKDTKIV